MRYFSKTTLLIIISLSGNAFANKKSTKKAIHKNLVDVVNNENIWQIVKDKKNTYYNRGIFHFPSKGVNNRSSLKKISQGVGKGFERLVFAFREKDEKNFPRVYGYISKENKIYIDFYNLWVPKQKFKIKKHKFVRSIDFFILDNEKVSVEVNLSRNAEIEVFYLTNDNRLVIDFKL